jgi:ferredoxin--NADP+ reductase
MLYIDPSACVDCGGCYDVCPVEAIVPDYDLRSDQVVFLELNAAYYRYEALPATPAPAG